MHLLSSVNTLWKALLEIKSGRSLPQMDVTVLFFANIKSIAERDQMVITLPEQACIADLKRQLVKQIPELHEVLETALTAINRNFAVEEQEIPPDSEVAFFPPMRGG